MKRQRRCSVCCKTGHDKRKCTEITKPKQKKKSSVVVRVSKNQIKSPHLVNLKDTSREDAFSQVNVYTESPATHSKREVVDFASMVRSAQTEKKKIKNKTKIGKRKLIKKFSPSLPKVRLRRPSLSWFWAGIAERISAFWSHFNPKRFAYQIAIWSIIFLLPFPAVGYFNQVKDSSRQVLEQSTNAFLALQSSTFAALQSDIGQAQYDLNLALESFSQAESVLDKEHKALVYVASMIPVVGAQVSSRQHLLSAGHHLALGNTYLVKGVSRVQETEEQNSEKIAILRAHVRSALPQYKEALEDLSAVKTSILPVEYQESFDDFKLLFAAFIDDMEDMSDLMDALRVLLGDEDLKRYLLVFQNNHELRPTGGFMGSIATVDLQKGKLLNWEVPGGGSYDIQGQLDVFVRPPLPLQLLNKRWELQDANWFPDFAASAQKIEWFYQHGKNKSMDGVIAINASVLERLLKVVGPVVSEEHDLILAGDSALSDLQREVEVDYDKEKNQPKEVIGDLFGVLIEKMGEVDSFDIVRLLTELNEALNQKEIQIYLNQESLQEEFRGYGWTGEVLPVSEQQDYLMVVNTNIHGQKSDASIEQTIQHQAVVQEDGSIINTVFVKREHIGVAGEQFYGTNNVSYLRLYVPEGAELIDAGGFSWPAENLFKVAEDWYEDDPDLANLEKEEGYHQSTGTRVTTEFDKTVFANWVAVDPGNTAEVYFSYKLPFNVFETEEMSPDDSNSSRWLSVFRPENINTSRYSLVAQKQSGINSHFSSSVIYPDGWRPAWRSTDVLELAANGAEFETTLETDENYGVVMENKIDN